MTSVTQPIRVLELGNGVSAAYAAKLLGDHGADVVKVETPDGDSTRHRGPFPTNEPDPEQSGTFLAFNLNKRGVCLDLETDTGRSELRQLIAWADVLVHNYARLDAQALGLGPGTLQEERPELVVLSITPFGITGPYRDYRAEEITVSNAGGWANLCPNTHPDPHLPPLKVFGHQCALMAGITGAMAALAMARDARRSGVGDYIDLSEQAYVASVLEGGITAYSYLDTIRTRRSGRVSVPWAIYETKDSPIFLVCIEQDQWERFVELMGSPDWATLEVFADKAGRVDNHDIINMFIGEYMSGVNAFELYHEGQNQRICFAPVMDFEQLAADKHIRARGAFVTVEHPVAGAIEYIAPAMLTNSGRAAIRRPAPLLGQHTDEALSDAKKVSQEKTEPLPTEEARLPLAGIRVIDLSWVWAGAFCAMNLAHLGAEVIRLESEARPDLYRRGKTPEGMEPGLNRSGMFNQWNQGKRSVAVDLSSAEGKELVKAFIANADVVVQNFATGVMERLGLGYDELKRINPRIILTSISGYGQTGPYSTYMGYGPAFAALSGLSAMTGYAGGGPEELGVSMPDPTAGITSALAVISALERRDQTGVGDHLDLGLWESTQATAAEGWMQYVFNGTQPERMGNRDPQMAPHGCYACRGEDGWVSIACADDTQWAKFAGVIDPSLVDDVRFQTLAGRKSHEDKLEEIVSAWTGTRDRWEITKELQAAGIAAFPSFTCKDIVEDPHLNERGFIERLEHPEVGRRAHAGIPWRLQRRPNGVRMPAPCLGADTDKLLADVLGYDEKKITALHELGVLH